MEAEHVIIGIVFNNLKRTLKFIIIDVFIFIINNAMSYYYVTLYYHKTGLIKGTRKKRSTQIPAERLITIEILTIIDYEIYNTWVLCWICEIRGLLFDSSGHKHLWINQEYSRRVKPRLTMTRKKKQCWKSYIFSPMSWKTWVAIDEDL